MLPAAIDCFAYRPILQQQLLCFRLADSELVHDHPRAALHKLLVGKLHIYHTVAAHVAQLDHNRGRDHVQHQLLGGTGFHARAARYKLRAYNHFDRKVCMLRHLRACIANNTTP